MNEQKHSQIRTAYQRHINTIKILGLAFLILPVLAAGIIIWANSSTGGAEYSIQQETILLACPPVFLLGISLCVIGSIRQSKADMINKRLYAIWRCRPETIYTFFRKQTRYQKKEFGFLLPVLPLILLGVLEIKKATTKPIGILLFIAAGIFFLLWLFRLPYARYLALRINTALWGDAKEIIFSRAGIWFCGTLYYFEDRRITYHRVERKDMHGQDAIVFTYTQTSGFQQNAKELAIPVPAKMSYAADDLVAEFNRSDLLENNSGGSIFEK